MKIELDIENCLDCPKHISGYDPDPYDSFCSDDKYCACTLLPNDRLDKSNPRFSQGQPYRIVTCADRPYQLKKYCTIPEWCPLVKKDEDR